MPDYSIALRGNKYDDRGGFGAAMERAATLRSMVQQQQIGAQTQEQNQLKLDQVKREGEGRTLLSNLLSNNRDPGTGKVNHAAVLGGLSTGGYGDMAMQYEKQRIADEKEQRASDTSLVNNEKTELENAHTKLTHVSQLLASSQDEESKNQNVAGAYHFKYIDKATAERMYQTPFAQLKPEFDRMSQSVLSEADKLKLRIDAEKAAQEARKSNAEIGGVTAESQAKMLGVAAQSIGQVANQEQYSAWLAQQPEAIRGTLPPTFSPATVKTVQDSGKKAHELTTEVQTGARDLEAGRHNKTTEGITMRGQNMTAQAARERNAMEEKKLASGELTPEDYKTYGAIYAMTGEMPALGNGSGQAKQKILHAAGSYAQENHINPREMALAKSAFKGDTKSLGSFQTQRDAISSFEATAQKNIDTFLTAAQKIPDTGVPWLNTPLRLLDEKLVGSGNMAAVNAARQVANNEIAKVTSGGGLGGVLSDSARHEVDSYNPRDATLKQTIDVVKMLRSDMSARRNAMDATIGEIRSRVGSFGGSGGAAPHGAPPAAGGGIKVTDPNGGVHAFADQAAADKFKKLAGIK